MHRPVRRNKSDGLPRDKDKDMANNYAPTVADVFGLLDEWRHLPAYGLETRVAPFFALFLREVLSARFGVELHSSRDPGVSAAERHAIR